MDEEIERLNTEIVILNKRINYLEKKESKRRALFYIRLFIKIIIVGIFAFAVWKGYDYVVNGIPKIVEEKVSDLNPFKSLIK